MGFDWYESDDTTPAGTSYTLSTSAGTPSSAIELHAWLNKGSSIGSPETRYLRVYAEDSGIYRTSGLDVLDRREIEIKISGSQNPDGVPGFSAPTTAWTAVGTRRTFQLPAIYPNCCIEVQLRINPAMEGGSSSPVTFRVKAVLGTGEVPVSIPNDVIVEGDLGFGGHTLSGVVLGTGVSLSDEVDCAGQRLTAAVLGTGSELGDELDAGGYAVSNLARSSGKTFAASVEVVYQRGMKRACRAAATSNVASLSGEQTVDGVALTDGQRVLLTAQSTAAEIGCWYVKTGAWERPPDNDDSYQVYPGILVVVVEGTNKGIWVQTGSWGTEAWAKVVALP